jgi:hypothetical protein
MEIIPQIYQIRGTMLAQDFKHLLSLQPKIASLAQLVERRIRNA